MILALPEDLAPLYPPMASLTGGVLMPGAILSAKLVVVDARSPSACVCSLTFPWPTVERWTEMVP